MQSKLSYVLVSVIAIVLAFLLSNCSLIFSGIGAIGDASKSEFQGSYTINKMIESEEKRNVKFDVNNGKVLEVKPKSMINIKLHDDRQFDGEFRGLSPDSGFIEMKIKRRNIIFIPPAEVAHIQIRIKKRTGNYFLMGLVIDAAILISLFYSLSEANM